MTTKTASNKPKDMDAWTMLCSVLNALRQTEDAARGEWAALRDASPNNPFAKGIGGASALFEIAQSNRKNLENEMFQNARSCGLTVPEWQR